MSIMYKYLNIKVLNEFLKNPAIKLSNPKELNDPFESSITSNIENLFNKIDKDKPRLPVDIWEIKSAINGMGIVSLTETHRNKLMWAHYADEHKGVAIGFNTKILSEYISDIATNDKGILIPPKLYKVKYDSVRFDPESPENTALNTLDTNSLIQTIIEKVTTTKSDDWIYEKEYRYILPPGYCDKIKIIRNGSAKLNPAIEREIKRDIVKEIERESSDANEITIYLKDNYSFVEKMSIVRELKFLCNTIPLMSIPKNCIASIHFGARVEFHEKYPVVNFINKEKEYEGVNISEYKICEKRFDLIATPIK